MKAQDIILNDDGLMISGGDLLVQESDNQHVNHILIAEKGQFLMSPLIGVGLKSMLNGPVNTVDIKKYIRMNLESDDMIVKRLIVLLNNTDLRMDIDAERRMV